MPGYPNDETPENEARSQETELGEADYDEAKDNDQWSEWRPEPQSACRQELATRRTHTDEELCANAGTGNDSAEDTECRICKTS
jgi:hypothetical protein